MVFNSFGPDHDLSRASREQGPPAAGWVAGACELKRLRPGRLGAALHARGTEAGLPAADSARLIRLFLSAGIDTTVGAIGGLLHSLAACAGQWAILRSRPDLARQAFEEAIRFVSPCRSSSGPPPRRLRSAPTRSRPTPSPAVPRRGEP